MSGAISSMSATGDPSCVGSHTGSVTSGGGVTGPDLVSGFLGRRSAQREGGSRTSRVLPLVYDDLALFKHDLRLQHLVDVERRVAVDQDDVGELARLQCSDLIGHADE